MTNLERISGLVDHDICNKSVLCMMSVVVVLGWASR